MDFKDTVLADLMARIRALEADIERRVAEKRSEFHYSVERNRIRFEQGVQAGQLAFRRGLWQQLRESPLPFLLISPVIYSLILPLALLDLFLAVYQATSFRVYGIDRVRRSDYVVIDRQHLAYLNPLEKLNCVYCSYANGLIAYAREIASRTEEYWCPIKHSRPVAMPHSRYVHFVDYGDAEGYHQRKDGLRDHATKADESPPKS
jgi:hypothetical protein